MREKRGRPAEPIILISSAELPAGGAEGSRKSEETNLNPSTERRDEIFTQKREKFHGQLNAKDF